jgi:Zn-dependent M28 family amino/carboxypeptidase
MIGAPYDHLDSRSNASGRCAARGTPGGEICNGAADDASGVAATLAIGKAIRKMGRPRRSVILAFWDSEEDALNGSAYYAAHPLVPNAAVRGYVNFDIQGANLLPSAKRVSFALGPEAGDVDAALVAARGLLADPERRSTMADAARALVPRNGAAGAAAEVRALCERIVATRS